MSNLQFLKGFNVVGNSVAQSSYELFNKLGVPTSKNENWHYTDLSKILKNEVYNSKTRIPPVEVEIDDCIKLVIGNGTYGFVEDDKELKNGIDLSPVTDLKYTSRFDNQTKHSMVALNNAMYEDGISITISKDMDKPLHLAYVNSGDNLAVFPRVFIEVETGVNAQIIETYESIAGDKIFVNAVNEILVGEDANLLHYKVQDDEAEMNHISFTKTSVLKSGKYSQTFIFLNGITTRNEVHTDLLGEFASCEVQGIYLTNNKQVVDNTVLVNHLAPNSESSQLFKGILDDSSTGIFQGKIYVDKEAQKTDGYQMHRSVMLSRDCEVKCKPELEIYADDVKCSHGASTGEIAEEQLFYLMTRGIDKAAAKNILLKAFLLEVLDNIYTPQIREYLRKVTLRKASCLFSK